MWIFTKIKTILDLNYRKIKNIVYPSVPHRPLSSTHQFHTKGSLLFSSQNPSVPHHKLLSSSHPSDPHRLYRAIFSLRGVLNWGVCGTEGCVKLRGFRCWTFGFLVWNWGVLVLNWGVCWTEGFLVWNWGVCWTEGFWCGTKGFRGLKRSGTFCVELMSWTEGDVELRRAPHSTINAEVGTSCLNRLRINRGRIENFDDELGTFCQ